MLRLIGYPFVAICFCLALINSASAGTPRYQLTQLNSIATAVGTYAVASAINDSGQVAGGESALTGSGTSLRVDWTKVRPITWDASGTAKLLPGVTGYGGLATSINNSGLIAGVSASTTGTSPTRATLFKTTGATLLAAQGASSSSVAGVNAGGTVLVQDSGVLYRFNSTSNTFTQIAGANGYFAIGINDSESVLTNGPFTVPAPVPYRFDSGATAGTKLYTSGPTPGFASDFNNKGNGVGNARSNLYYLPASYSGGTASVLTLGTYTAGYANGLNDRGDIVGTAGNGNFASKDGKAFLRRDGVMIDLSTLINGAALPVGFNPTDINDRGQIIGNTLVDDDNNAATPNVGRAYILNPIRTPGDTNYDNVVNFADLVTLAQNYNKSGDGNVFWETGDFNFDWKVDFSDLVILAQHYSAPSSFEGDWALAQSLVPEPASALSAIAIAACATRRRRLHCAGASQEARSLVSSAIFS